MATNPVGWFEIYVDDMSRAKAFYEAVLQVKLTPIANPEMESLQMHAFPADMEQHGSSGALVHCDGFPVGNNSTLVYFVCDDCSEEEARVAGAGGQVQRSKMAIGEYGFIALALDTEGNMFGLHSLK